jgi:hypothetical protein
MFCLTTNPFLDLSLREASQGASICTPTVTGVVVNPLNWYSQTGVVQGNDSKIKGMAYVVVSDLMCNHAETKYRKIHGPSPFFIMNVEEAATKGTDGAQ